MAQGPWAESRLKLNYLSAAQTSVPRSEPSTSNSSPSEPAANASTKSTVGGSNSMASNTTGLGSARLGAGSPLHEQPSRLFPKRTRELQAREGLSPNIWGPPTSGNSTPLRETIPESPSQDGFPDLVPPSDVGLTSPAGRARAGTVPSRFSPVTTLNGSGPHQSLLSKTSRPTPSTSPFKPPSTSPADTTPKPPPPTSSSNSTLLSRLRAGSVPQRSGLGPTSAFGSSLFTSGWSSNRDRTSTLTSIRSSEDPSSPILSPFSRDGLTDTDVRTLDYLGLVETPQPGRATLVQPVSEISLSQQQPQNVLPQLLANFQLKSANRFRSYSVNASEKYANDVDDADLSYSPFASGTLTPSAAATAAQMSALQSQIDQHNQAVQAYARNVSAARPRARTAGLLDTPSQHIPSRQFLPSPSRIESGLTSADMLGHDGGDTGRLATPLNLMNLSGAGLSESEMGGDNEAHVSRSLWIGSIPVSTTNSSLDVIFSQYGRIESTRVLTHKNCGFVNFESIDNAIEAKQSLNGKEIFPGSGPVRIGFAKAPSNSTSGTPGYNEEETSPTPEPYQNNTGLDSEGKSVDAGGNSTTGKGCSPKTSNGHPSAQALPGLRAGMLDKVVRFGAGAEDLHIISSNIDSAIAYQDLESEIPSIPEPSHVRVYDAPRLRDVRKRIDSGACGVPEMEEIAIDMLPEIAELSSDYLGNTVVQKFFEFGSEEVKEEMLIKIAPHLAEIGVHKNGTWAAQKIIDVCKSATQMALIVKSLRPFTIPLFLDQYGNYVLQCCLRFGSPYNDFIFETMISHLWEIAQGRFGARAMRACLESHYATKHQQRMLASAIALHSVQLATNANGALLLTWFLDTCTFPQRRTVLAPQLVSHLVELCTHKVAYLTVLKVVNQKNEPEARDIVLRSLFFSPGEATLERILSDQASGATLVFKILTTPFFDESTRLEVSRTVAKVLTRIKAQPSQGYKRLMDEVGLSSRPPPMPHALHGHGHPNNVDRPRPMNQQANPNLVSTQSLERQYNSSYLPPAMPAMPYDAGSNAVRNGSADSSNLAQYGLSGQASFAQSSLQQATPQQLQYQAYLSSAQRNNGAFLPPFPANGYGGYPTPPPSAETYRNLQQGSPLAAPAQMGPIMTGSPFGQHYSPSMGSGMYGYPQQNAFAQPVSAMQGGRRGRR